MKACRISAVILRHLYEARRNFDRWFDVIYWPILDVIVWGFITIYLSKRTGLGFNLTSFLLGAVILWTVFYMFMRDIAIGFLDEVWSKNLINLFSSPLMVWEYIIGLLAVNLVKVIISTAFASLIALLIYKFNIFSLSFLLLPYLLNILVFAAALGFFVTGLILRYTTRVQALSWSFAGIIQPISAVFYPVSVLPPLLQKIAWLLPTTYSFEAMRQIFSGNGFSVSHFWYGLALNGIYLLISVFVFKKIFEKARQRGLLVKLE